ncbi:MAG: VgrG-related protein [Chloroflexota bacterium]|nr:VgrG-related protein [Chloroflexota bacterium]
MANIEYISIAEFNIKVEGTKIDEALQNAIVELVVDSNLQLPDMVSLQFYSPDSAIVDNDTFKIGKTLEVQVAEYETALFEGEITAVEPVFTSGGYVQMVVRGYDKSHRLHRGKKIRTFLKMTDSNIVSKIAQEAGLQAVVDATSPQHEHVWQNNQTDMEFLRSRARRLGYFVYVEDQKLHFSKQPPGGQSIELEWGKNLRDFRPRLAVTHQVDQVTVRSWDPVQKQAVSSEVTSATNTQHQGGESRDGGQVAQSAFGGSAENLVVTYPRLQQSEAKNMAQALYNRTNGNFVRAEGTCVGDPKISAGKIVKLVGVGERFGGTYVVTSARHIFATERNYETTFHVRGQQAEILSYLLQGGAGPQTQRALINGVVIGLVTNNNDPDGGGRVKVKFPWLDEELESDWIRMAAPGAGKERGFYLIPEIDDEVLVAFEHGDIHSPYVLGGLWNGKDAAPKKSDQVVAAGVVNERLWQSRSGHLVLLGDEDGKEQIVIRDKTGKNEIIIDSKENTLTINVAGDYTVASKGASSSTSDKTTELTSKGHMTLKADGGSNVTVQGTKIIIKGQSAVEIQATGNLTLKANGKLALQGTQVSIQGQAMTEVKSAGMLQLQGSLVKIN